MLPTPKEQLENIGQKFKEIRLLQRLKRKSLALKSGVSESSIKRFETLGEISLESLLKISNVLNIKDWVVSIMDEKYYPSLDVMVKTKNKIKKRGII